MPDPSRTQPRPRRRVKPRTDPRHPTLGVTLAARARVLTTPRTLRSAVPRTNVHGKRHAARGPHRGAMTDATTAHACQRCRCGMPTSTTRGGGGGGCTRFARGELQPFYAYADSQICSCERASTLCWDWSRTGIATWTLGYQVYKSAPVYTCARWFMTVGHGAWIALVCRNVGVWLRSICIRWALASHGGSSVMHPLVVGVCT